MQKIVTVGVPHPPAPLGARYIFTLYWETNRIHTIPYDNLFRYVLTDNGDIVVSGKGFLSVHCSNLPAKVHIYVPLPGSPEAS